MRLRLRREMDPTPERLRDVLSGVHARNHACMLQYRLLSMVMSCMLADICVGRDRGLLPKNKLINERWEVQLHTVLAVANNTEGSNRTCVVVSCTTHSNVSHLYAAPYMHGGSELWVCMIVHTLV